MGLVAGLSARDSMDMVPADWRDLIPRYYPRLSHADSEPVQAPGRSGDPRRVARWTQQRSDGLRPVLGWLAP